MSKIEVFYIVVWLLQPPIFEVVHTYAHKHELHAIRINITTKRVPTIVLTPSQLKEENVLKQKGDCRCGDYG